MIKTHFKIIFRNIFRNKIYSGINIIGLSIGILSFLVIFSVVADELSYDKFWSNKDNLYKLRKTTIIGSTEIEEAIIPIGLANGMLSEFPELDAYTRIKRENTVFKKEKSTDEFITVDLIKADTTFTQMFDMNVVEGSLTPYIKGVRNLVITESFQKRYFNNINPVGKIIYDIPKWYPKSNEYVITAVIKDIPQNTHLRGEVFQLTNPYPSTLGKRGDMLENIYLQLQPNTDISALEKKISTYYKEKLQLDKENKFTVQPVEEVYLNSSYDKGLKIKNNRTNIILLGTVAFFLLIIACINFINLSTARMMKRVKETGIRKIMGAEKSGLIRFYLLESFTFFGIAGIISLVSYAIILPVIENYMGHQLTMNLVDNMGMLSAAMTGIILLSLIIGAYPAWAIAGINPSESLKKNIFKNSYWKGAGLRKSLVVTQFSLAIIIIISLFVINNQIKLINEKDLGYNKENLLAITAINWGNEYPAFKNELLNVPGIKMVGGGMWSPLDKSAGRNSFTDVNNPEEKIPVDVLIVNTDFAETVELKLVKGRLSDEQFGTDKNAQNNSSDLFRDQNATKDEEESSIETGSNILITESTAKMLSITETDKLIAGSEFIPIGIVQDLFSESLHNNLSPTIILLSKEMVSDVYVRYEPEQLNNVVAAIHKTGKKIYPNTLFEITPVTDLVNKLYQEEHKQQEMIFLFGVIMLILSCLGVFGLIVHEAEQRVKEIGIRKVLGASVNNLVQLLSMDFVKLVLIAIIIATPLAWLAMQQWLNNFAYKTSVQWWMFALAGLIAILITLITTGIHSFNAANANPVKSLRDE